MLQRAAVRRLTAGKNSRITDADEFRENCLRCKQCALIIFDGIYTEGAMQHRGVAVAELDTALIYRGRVATQQGRATTSLSLA